DARRLLNGLRCITDYKKENTAVSSPQRLSQTSSTTSTLVLLSRCDFNSTELKDIRFTDSYYYNMIEIIRFDSNVGTFVGFTDFGVKTAEAWNNIPARLATMRAQKGTYCKPNIDVRYHNLMSKSAVQSVCQPPVTPPPTVKLHSTTPLSSHHPAMLVCSVYDFFPEVTSDVTSTEEMEDGDWYYQTTATGVHTQISCVVEHASLEKPLITNWGKYLSVSTHLTALCLILSLAGFIYYRQRARGQRTTLTHRPVHTRNQFRPETSSDQTEPFRDTKSQTTYDGSKTGFDQVYINIFFNILMF
uniref:MHC class II beta chain N-terminal domain-containing protein n=1 Tax=Maylandia zebra TaxID=106582 RepID=A0A3P9DK95_9CICH